MQKDKAINLKQMKNANKALVLETIWKSEGLSRTELSEVTGLSPATITSLSELLLKENMIVEAEAVQSTGGRRPVLLKLNPSGGFICTLRVLPGSISYTIFNMNLEKLHEITKGNSQEIMIQGLFENIILNVDKILEGNGINKKALIGIGISMSNSDMYVDSKVMFDTSISSDLMHLDEAISFTYNTPVFIEDEINVKAIAEYHLGVVKGRSEFVYIDINDEIEATIIQNGEIVNNSLFTNNRIGHMIIDRNGPKCSCGRKGCLQSYASINSIAKRLFVSLLDKGENILSSFSKKNNYEDNLDMIFDVYSKDSSTVDEILKEVCEIISTAIINIYCMFNIKDIVIGGRIRKIKSFEKILLEATHRDNLMEEEKPIVNIAKLSEGNVSIGSGAIVISNYFKALKGGIN
jgi:predicted NBD/HSP70 family sugar kinase